MALWVKEQREQTPGPYLNVQRGVVRKGTINVFIANKNFILVSVFIQKLSIFLFIRIIGKRNVSS
jgi:hypothetical protein